MKGFAGKSNQILPCGLACLLLVMLVWVGNASAQEKGTRDTVLYPTWELIWADEGASKLGRLFSFKRYVLTENFAIFFLPSETPDEYVWKLKDALERSFSKFIKELGYQVPDFARDYRINVYVKKYFREGQESWLGYVPSPKQDIPPWVVMRATMSDSEIKGTCAHELFHVIQDGYGRKKEWGESWVREGTAKWAEDEVWGGGNIDIGYPERAQSWWQGWGRAGTPFSGTPGDDTRTPKNTQVWYGNAFLFKYWTEHLTGGTEIIKEIFEPPRLTASLAKKKVASVIAAHSEQKDFGYELLRAAVGTYLLEAPDPYNLKRGAEIATIFDPWTRPPQGWYYTAFERDRARIHPKIDSIRPLAAQYSSIEAKRVHLVEPTELFLYIKPDDPKDVRVAVIEHSSRFPSLARRSRVTLLDPLPNKEYQTYVIPRFKEDVDQTTEVDIVVVNANLAASRSFTWSYAVSPPPYLETVKIWVDETKLAYDAQWKGPEMPDAVLDYEQYTARKRQLEIKVDKLPEDSGDEDSLKGVRVELRFSEPVAVSEAHLGGTRLEALPEAKGKAMREWIFGADLVDISKGVAGGKLKLRVGAEDESGTRLDAKPATPAALSTQVNGWSFFEDPTGALMNEGGEDQNHAITLQRGPPYLKSVQFKAGGEVYYQAEWNQPEGAEERTLEKQVDRAVDIEEVKKGEIELVFSRPLKRVLLLIGGREFNLKPAEGNKVFRGWVVLAGMEPVREIPIEVAGEDMDGQPLDGNPKTIARFPDTGYEKERDTWHKIKTSKEAPLVGRKFRVDSVFKKADAEEINRQLPLPKISDDDIHYLAEFFQVYGEDRTGREKRIQWHKKSIKVPRPEFGVKTDVKITENDVPVGQFDSSGLVSITLDRAGFAWEDADYHFSWEMGSGHKLWVNIMFRVFRKSKWPLEVTYKFESTQRMDHVSKRAARDLGFDDAYKFESEREFQFHGLRENFMLYVSVLYGPQYSGPLKSYWHGVTASELGWKIVEKVSKNIEHIEFVE